MLQILKFVHANQVIHRDIKPTNIIRREQDNKLVLIDFGAVKEVTSEESTDSTVVIGTPGYMPEEQRNGRPNYSSDIYAVGMVCIQALIGLSPPSGINIFELPRNPQHEIIWRDRVQVSNGLAKILNKMIRSNYQERYSSVEEVIQKVEKLRNTSRSRNKTLLIFLLICLTAAAAIGGLSFYWFKDKLITSVSRIKLDGTEINQIFEGSDISNNPLDETYSHQYIFTGQKGQLVNIEMKSEEVDPSLELLKADKSQLEFNDDISPDNFHSRITFSLPEDGDYIVIARSSQVGELGSYRLSANILSE